MTHGKKVERAVVLVHGYTNCPNEFVGLRTRLYDMGYNVLVAPLPHQGLGDKVTILGYSCGGVVTAWQHKIEAMWIPRWSFLLRSDTWKSPHS
jgi:esterase/lipase